MKERRVRFDHAGRSVEWGRWVDDDWLDPAVLTSHATMLARSNSPLRLFTSSADDSGQATLLTALTPEHEKRFRTMIGIAMERLVQALRLDRSFADRTIVPASARSSVG